MRRVAKAAAEIVELVEILEGDANVAALAAGMANRDFSPERQGEFVLKRKRVGVDGRDRPSRPRRFAKISRKRSMSRTCLRRRCGRQSRADRTARPLRCASN